MFNVSIAAFLQKHHRFGASVQFPHHFAQRQFALVRVSPHDGHDLFAKHLFVQVGHKITEQRRAEIQAASRVVLLSWFLSCRLILTAWVVLKTRR